MWYILDCEPDSFLYFGVNKEITKEEFERRIHDNTLLDVLKAVPVHKGDVFFIKSGTIHAIGAGIQICEIQQNSNTTYRVYVLVVLEKMVNLVNYIFKRRLMFQI